MSKVRRRLHRLRRMRSTAQENVELAEQRWRETRPGTFNRGCVNVAMSLAKFQLYMIENAIRKQEALL